MPSHTQALESINHTVFLYDEKCYRFRSNPMSASFLFSFICTPLLTQCSAFGETSCFTRYIISFQKAECKYQNALQLTVQMHCS